MEASATVVGVTVAGVTVVGVGVGLVSGLPQVPLSVPQSLRPTAMATATPLMGMATVTPLGMAMHRPTATIMTTPRLTVTPRPTVMLQQLRTGAATGDTAMAWDIEATASPGLGTADTGPDTSAPDTGERSGMAGTEAGMPGGDTEGVLGLTADSVSPSPHVSAA